jgi:hypothetical protein
LKAWPAVAVLGIETRISVDVVTHHPQVLLHVDPEPLGHVVFAALPKSGIFDVTRKYSSAAGAFQCNPTVVPGTTLICSLAPRLKVFATGGSAIASASPNTSKTARTANKIDTKRVLRVASWTLRTRAFMESFQ